LEWQVFYKRETPMESEERHRENSGTERLALTCLYCCFYKKPILFTFLQNFPFSTPAGSPVYRKNPTQTLWDSIGVSLTRFHAKPSEPVNSGISNAILERCHSEIAFDGSLSAAPMEPNILIVVFYKRQTRSRGN
jgi:hypothetical protein